MAGNTHRSMRSMKSDVKSAGLRTLAVSRRATESSYGLEVAEPCGAEVGGGLALVAAK
jgi:hypothetical protein